MFMLKSLILFLLPISLFAQLSPSEMTRALHHASNVTIIRDNWGIPHIYGKSDADAVFGLLYAQCEDDFKRVEMNYIEKLGRLGEVNGENEVYNDLLVRLVIDTAEAKKDYRESPEWLHKLLDAYADGINYFLHTHPDIKPALLTHFEPWYPMLWTDGSIGAITTAGLNASDLQQVYGKSSGKQLSAVPVKPDLYTGSNGFAIAPSNTKDKSAILYINPHVTFYFRPEVHIVSEEGLNVYGAVTWGQFFIYQGFNEHCGWMHTSSQVDVSDSYIEKLSQENGNWQYSYQSQNKPVTIKPHIFRYKSGDTLATVTIQAMYTHHGPIMGKSQNGWLSVRSFNRSSISLQQSWLRTKATSYAEFRKVLDLRGNTSNNTVYADAEGNIAYWHGNFVPRRDTSYNWNKPVDGTIAATEWQGLHAVKEIIQSINPPTGWLQNCNSTPFTVAGKFSPKQNEYPRYMAADKENFRGITAVKVLSNEKKFTIDKVIAAGYDRTLSFFEKLIPALVKAYKNYPDDSLKQLLREPVEVLQKWDMHSGKESIGTTIGATWADFLNGPINSKANPDNNEDQVTQTAKFAADTSNEKLLLETLATAINKLNQNYGTWNIPWGSINRFQRINNELEPTFDDLKPSIPVGFVSSQWGQLASYYSASFHGSRKRYGVYGNSFICAVQFGKKIKAKSLLAGGQSGNMSSKHFADQAEMYAEGKFKEVLFYKNDIQKHAEQTYHPGDRQAIIKLK
jgi:acyl-homoserine lactone acylase PvdQ